MWVFNTEYCTGEVETKQFATEAEARAVYLGFLREWRADFGEECVFFSSRNSAQFRYVGCVWSYCSFRAA